MPVAIAVLEDEHTVRADDGVRLPGGIREALDHPEPSAFVRGHGDRLNHVRLAGEKGHLKTFRDAHVTRGLHRRQRAVGFRRIGGNRRNREHEQEELSDPNSRETNKHARCF